ncbi:MAG TPA: 5-(carboxyamino)imidazole ribonucleotide synthase [Gemmatimonadales bacterium]|nr:5-(carboxyamino)imidazole ribonucleotide synthase [Gemmatimonadales bacterium]
MILPGQTLGMLGGGQLGRMFTLKARAMGYQVVVLDPDPLSPAGAAANSHIHAQYDDPAALDRLARECAVVSTEFENVPAVVLERLAARIPVHPSAVAVAVCQDRITEKSFLRDHGFATAEFRPVASGAEAGRALAEVGAPALLKTSRLGYDGKGQAKVTSAAEAEAAFARFGGVPCVLEQLVPLDLEISVVLARGQDGAVAPFPAGENVHRNGILHTTTVPARIPEALAREARETAGKIAERLGYVGVLGVEMFVSRGKLLINELAPRPHNSGHWTQDAAVTDQFEQQVRAMCGLPLGSPALLTPVAMVNVLGDLWAKGEPDWAAVMGMPGVVVHLYGKKEPRAGRKMGHLNCYGATADEALRVAEEAWGRLGGRTE